MKFNLNNKIAIVTGASQGIGKIIAFELAKSGAHVACISRNKKAIESIVDEITINGGQASSFPCDISDSDTLSEIITEIIKDNRIDILVNNAGITKDSLLMRMSIEQWDDVINTNLKGAFHCTKAVVRYMMKNKFGRIINITSIVGLTGNAGQANYAASKAGLIGMTKSIAKEVASRGITANCIAPGWIETSMTFWRSEK